MIIVLEKGPQIYAVDPGKNQPGLVRLTQKNGTADDPGKDWVRQAQMNTDNVETMRNI